MSWFKFLEICVWGLGPARYTMPTSCATHRVCQGWREALRNRMDFLDAFDGYMKRSHCTLRASSIASNVAFQKPFFQPSQALTPDIGRVGRGSLLARGAVSGANSPCCCSESPCLDLCLVASGADEAGANTLLPKAPKAVKLELGSGAGTECWKHPNWIPPNRGGSSSYEMDLRFRELIAALNSVECSCVICLDSI